MIGVAFILLCFVGILALRRHYARAAKEKGTGPRTIPNAKSPIRIGVAISTALVVGLAFIMFSQKHESSGRNASAPPEHEGKTQQTEAEPPVNFMLPLYTKGAAFVCPLAVAFDRREGYGLKAAVDAHLSIFGHDEAIAKFGCQEWQEGLPVSLTDEGKKRAAQFNAGNMCGMVEFNEGLIFSCDLQNNPTNNRSSDATPQAPVPGAAQTDAQARDASPTAPESDITMDLNVTRDDQKLILNVKTNLPPKTILRAVLVRPTNQGGDGYAAEASAAVQANQIVQFGPFTKTSPGIYVATVTTALDQPKELQRFFREKPTGPLVTVISGTGPRFVSQTFQFKLDPDASAGNLPPDEHSNIAHGPSAQPTLSAQPPATATPELQPAIADRPTGNTGGSAPSTLPELEQRRESLAERAISLSALLHGLQQVYTAQGINMNMRGDIVASQQRMQARLYEAKSALKDQDVSRVRECLDRAETEVVNLEKSLRPGGPGPWEK